MRDLWIFIGGVFLYPVLVTLTAVLTEVSGDIRGWLARRNQAPLPAMLTIDQVDDLFGGLQIPIPERMAIKMRMVERHIMEERP